MEGDKLTDFDTWMLDVGYDRIFRMNEFRKPGDWTPYEMDKKFADESRFVDDISQFVKIKEAIELPDGDIFLGLQFICDPDNIEELENLNSNPDISYYKLSEIRLSYCGDGEEYE